MGNDEKVERLKSIKVDIELRKLLFEVDLHDIDKVLREIALMKRGKSLIVRDKILNLIKLRDRLKDNLSQIDNELKKIQIEINHAENENPNF